MGDRRFRFQELRNRGVLDFGDGYRAKNAELEGNGPIFLRAAYLQDTGFTFNAPDRFKETSLDRFGPKVAQIGDVVITTKGNSTGRIGVIREREAGSVYSPHLSYWRSLSPEVLDQRYLYFWSRSADFRDQLHSLAYSTDMAPYLSLRDQASVTIPLPPIQQQCAAAAILGALEDKIDLNRRINETLEAMAGAIFKDWFVDFGPTRAKAGDRDPYLAPEIWERFPDAFDDDDMPVGWRNGALQEIVQLNPKERLPKGIVAPYLEMAALPTSGSIADVPIEREFTSGTRFRNEDTLLARITPCLENGKTAFVQGLPSNTVGWGSTEFIVMRPRPPVPMPYAYMLARENGFRTYAIQSMTGTSGRQRARTEALAVFPVAIPDDSVWQAFGSMVNPMFKRIQANADESRILADTRDLLLPKLMSGDIRLPDAEKQAEAVA